jgi:hypothetical protein
LGFSGHGCVHCSAGTLLKRLGGPLKISKQLSVARSQHERYFSSHMQDRKMLKFLLVSSAILIERQIL